MEFGRDGDQEGIEHVSERPCVLYVDAGGTGEIIQAAVDRTGYRSLEAVDGADAFKRLDDEAVDVVVVPASLPDVSIDAFVGRVDAGGAPIVVGTVEGFEDPIVNLPPDVPVAVLADRIERAVRHRRLGAALDRHDRLTSAFLRIADAVTESTNTASIEGAVYEELVRTGAYELVWVGRYDRDADALDVVRPFERSVPVDDVGLVSEDDGFLSRAVASGAVTTSGAADPTATVLTAVPLTDGRRIHGVVVLGTAPDDAPDGSERSLLGRVGRIAGTALPRSDGEEAGDVGGEVEMLRVLAHELRDPLQAASIAVEIAEEEGNLDALDRATSAIETMSDVIDSLFLVASGEGVEADEVIEVHEVAVGVWREVDRSDAELTIAGPATARADRRLLERLLSNLLRNAVEHAGPDVSVRVGALPDGRGFYVEDDGPGIPPEERAPAFEAGRSEANESRDVGHRFVRRIADAHGWDVSITEGDSGGARIEVRTGEPVRKPRDELHELFGRGRGEFVFPNDATR